MCRLEGGVLDGISGSGVGVRSLALVVVELPALFLLLPWASISFPFPLFFLGAMFTAPES